MAVKENYTFLSCDNEKTTIHGVKWMPEHGDVKAVLQINHGMQEYIERYTEFAEFMTEHGFVVFGHDHIGHGDSVSSEADWGIMHTDTPSDTMVSDMFSNYKIAKEQYPDKPYFILGHSMGSYLLRKFLVKKAGELKGVNGAIIMGTGTESDITIKAGMAVVKMVAACKGWDYKSKFVAGLMFSAPYKKFDVTGRDKANSWLSRNVDSVTKYYSDPKDTYMFSLNGYRVLLECTGFDNRMENIRKMNLDIPVFFVSGKDDPVGNLGAGVTLAYEKFKEAGVRDVSMKLYENDRHEILNELDRQDVYEDILKWFEEHMA
ncbi:MAG: alpha/beta fold hydrolase [Lachnospiraceae bacterium]|nr:alpha/beta fold hydrolase [Lachnospiraceae bacterium]